jgi:hypothetical protein
MQGTLDIAILTIQKLVRHPLEIDACMWTTVSEGAHRAALVNNENCGFLSVNIDTETSTARVRDFLQPAQKMTH